MNVLLMEYIAGGSLLSASDILLQDEELKASIMNEWMVGVKSIFCNDIVHSDHTLNIRSSAV